MRVASFWLATLSVLIGSSVIGTSVAAASPKTCRDSCPCNEDQRAEHAEAESRSGDDCFDDADGIGHHEEAPCDNEFPDNCPECSCCLGLTAGIVPNVVPTVPDSVCSSKMIAHPDTPATGALAGVFRPPRSLA
jgi:hypothetical protein